jgi:hypothetical protein
MHITATKISHPHPSCPVAATIIAPTMQIAASSFLFMIFPSLVSVVSVDSHEVVKANAAPHDKPD